ncbi:MAG: acyl-CoA thioesterase [Crocinitomicaceae bacterium]|nr:acyl-CoA thioesterase [Crocinitomicaceae bacterium]|tara:strand:- start:373 stop:921 length:549 start_codon:yes stop_codon:yes gene_type:complete
MISKSPTYSRTTITELMIPSYANFSGKIHGGILLSLMDKVAFACASKHSGEYCVTVSVEGVEFFQPVEVGELVSLTASVIYVGKTSMIIGIHIESMKPKTGEKKHTNSCYFTMVAKNEIEKKTKVPDLKIENIDELKRFVEGKEIKKFSRKKRKLLDMGIESYDKENLLKACSMERCDVSAI